MSSCHYCLSILILALAPGLGTVGEKKPAGETPRLVAQLGHSRFGLAVVISPNGKQLLTGNDDGTARLWEVETGKELRAFAAKEGRVNAVAFSSDGKRLVTGHSNHKAILWDAESGKQLQVLNIAGFLNAVTAVAWSADGKWVLTGSEDSKVRLWEVDSGRELRTIDLGGKRSFRLPVAFSPDDKAVLAGGSDGLVRLWDVRTGEELQIFRGHAAAVGSVAFSRDGKFVLAGCDGKDATARLWDVRTGKELQTFRHNTFVQAAFSPDGKEVVTGDGDDTVRFWNPATGKLLRTFQMGNGGINAVALSPDGKSLATSSFGSNGVARLWDVETGKELRRFQGLTSRINALTFSHDGTKALVGAIDNTARLWDLKTGQEIRRFHGHTSWVTAVAFSPDDRLALTRSRLDGTVRLWEVATGKERRRFPKVRFSEGVAFSADGTKVLSADGKFACLWDTATGEEVQRFQGHTAPILAVAFSPDGKGVLTCSEDKTARLWEAASGREIHRFPGGSSWVYSGVFFRDGKRVLTSSGFVLKYSFWDPTTGKELGHLRDTEGGSRIVLSPDEKTLLTNRDETAVLLDVKTGQVVRHFRGHTDSVYAVAFSPDGKHVLTGGLDTTVRLWDAATGKELCRLVSFQDGSWAVIDAAGRFDAANGGNVVGLHWVVGNEAIALNQLKERYYDPGLLAKYLGLSKEPLRDVQAFREVKVCPGVEAAPPAPGSSKLTLKLDNRGGGIGKVQVFVNDRELLADAREPKFDANAGTATLTVNLAKAAALPGEKNQVRVVTWNAEGYLSSRGLDLDWVAPGGKNAQPIELHAIVVGISSYDSDTLKLRFAAKDAADMARALSLGGKRLFGADKVHLTLLCDAKTPGALVPTRANLEKAFAAARKCRPTDVLVVYLAGHGIALQEKGEETYCYLTREARTVNQDAFRDPEVRRQYSLSSAELTEWFKKIPSLKQVLILDTCAAGAAAGKLIEHRDVSADQIRAIDRLRDRTGFHVLMGCASDRVSYEASQYSQGLLTYALLQGMRGAKLRESEYVDVMDLFQYAADQVPQLARNVGGIQKPLVLAPRGTSFDIGRLKDEDKKLIPLAQVRPFLLRPALQNADENVLDDDLGLMVRLRKRLIEEGYAALRGPGGPAVVYVDADEMPGAVRPSGKYTVKGKTVRVRLLLRQDGKTVAPAIEVEGSRDDLDGLAERLAAAILGKLKTP